jgi:hypothetical protein
MATLIDVGRVASQLYHCEGDESEPTPVLANAPYMRSSLVRVKSSMVGASMFLQIATGGVKPSGPAMRFHALMAAMATVICSACD